MYFLLLAKGPARIEKYLYIGRIRVTSIHQTAPLWPLKVPSLSPLLEYQTVGLLSLATENRRSPSRLYLEGRGEACYIITMLSLGTER